MRSINKYNSIWRSGGRVLATPPIPTDLAVAVTSDTVLTLSWVSAFTTEIWRATTELGEYTLIATVDKGTLTYADGTETPLTPATTYYYKARGKNGSKYSEFGSVVSAFALPDLDKFLFLGYYSEISDGKMPNTLGEDWITVAGSAGSETYQVPNTASYIAADTDFIWFKADTTQRTTTTAMLIGYDNQRTIVKYGNISPNAISIIAIRKAGVDGDMTESETNAMINIFNLSIWWSGVLNLYGYVKSNRPSAQVLWLSPIAASGFTSEFVIDTILGKLDWTDNCSGEAEYEIYSNTNGAGRVLLTTTDYGIETYDDTSCKQNASVVYSVRTKIGSSYSDYVDATALLVPLCWKTDQSTQVQVKLDSLLLSPTSGKTVTVNWGDGNIENIAEAGVNNKTHAYDTQGQYNISLSGDLNNISKLNIINQQKMIGNVSNWLLPSIVTDFRLGGCRFTGTLTNWTFPSTLTDFYLNQNNELTGDISNWIIPASVKIFYLYINKFTGKIPNITSGATTLIYRVDSNRLSGTNITVFRKAMTSFDIKDQGVAFLTAEIDKLLKSIADYYETNAPTANCAFTMTGTNMGIPTGAASNVDKVRIEGYYTTAGYTATITVKTS